MSRLKAANNVATTLASGINDTATSLTVASATGFPDVPFRITIHTGNPADGEIIEVGGKSGATFSSLLRGRESTVAASWSEGAMIEMLGTAGMYEELVSTDDVRLPSEGEKAALAGTSGTPSSTNKYVTNDDSRMTDARTPTSHNHAATDITSGTLAVARGGTGIASYTSGNYIYASDTTTLAQKTPAEVLSNIAAMPLAGGTFSGTVNFADNIAQRPEIKDYAETVKAHGTTGGSITCNLENGNIQTITLNAATTFTFSNPPATGKAGSLTLIINQGTTAYAVTWPSSVDWSGGSAPNLSKVSTDYVLTFLTLDGGTTWRGWLSGKGFA